MIKNIDDNYSHYYHDHYYYHRHYYHLPQGTEDGKERSRIQELRQISRGRLKITILLTSRPLSLTFSCQDPSEFRCTEFKKMMQAIFLSGGLFLYSNGFYLQYLTAVYYQ